MSNQCRRRCRTSPGAEAIGGVNDEEEGTVLYRMENDDTIPITTARVVDRDIEDELLSENRRLRQIVEDAPIAPAVALDSDADRYDKGPLVNKRRLWIILVIIMVIVAGAVGAVLGVMLPPTSESSASPTVAPKPLSSLVDLLSSVSSDEGEDLHIPGKPQHEAVVWLSKNANLTEYSDEKDSAVCAGNSLL